MANIPLNLYQLTLLQKIILIEYADSELDKGSIKNNLTEAECGKIGAEMGIDSPSPLRKIFGEDHKKGYTLQSGKLDKIVRSLNLEEVKNWENFSETFTFDRKEIPMGLIHLPYLDKNFRKDIQEAVKAHLRIVYSKVPRKAALINKLHFDKIDDDIPHPKLKEYANTKWYAYFCFNFGDSSPKIIRSVFEIGNPPITIKSKAAKYEGFEDFSGSVRFSSNGMILIIDMLSRSTQERQLRIMLVVGAGNRPEVALGEYMNINRYGTGVHSPRVVMQHIDMAENPNPKPAILDVGHPEFEDIPKPILKFLHREDPNIRILPGNILSMHSLEKLASEEEKNRFQEKRVRLRKPFQVVLTSPRYSIEPRVFNEKYEKPLNDIKQHFESIKVGDIQAFEVRGYYLDSDPKPTKPRPFSFYSNRIRDCEIVIALLFDTRGSICESELTLAVETGKTVHILTTENRKFIPKILDRDEKDGPNFQVHDDFKDANAAVTWLKTDPVIFARELAELKKYLKQQVSFEKE